MSGGNAPGTGFGVKFVGESFADGVNASAWMELCLEDGNVVSRAFQFPSGCEPGQSRAQDRDSLSTDLSRGHILRQGPAWISPEVQAAASCASRQLQEFPSIDGHARAE